MYTEDEAKLKWCPATRVSGGGTEWHTNRPSHAEVHEAAFDRCIGSACMAWRWGMPDVQYDPEQRVLVSEVPNADGSHTVVEQITNTSRPVGARRGYCGLSGRPE